MAKMISELTVLFLHLAPSLSLYRLLPTEMDSWIEVCPPLQLPASNIKQNFLPTNLTSLLVLGLAAVGPHLY